MCEVMCTRAMQLAVVSDCDGGRAGRIRPDAYWAADVLQARHSLQGDVVIHEESVGQGMSSDFFFKIKLNCFWVL